MELLSERAPTAEGVENEGDMAAVRDLADDLRDAVVEYQVRKNVGKYAHNDSHMVRSIVRATEGNLRAEL